jgi:AcrR family transcriptional regulator
MPVADRVPGTPPDRESPDTRERILAASYRLFFERGYEGTSISAIAKEVKISPPTLYWHFASKQEILYCFLESTLRDFSATVGEPPDSDVPADRLRHLAASHVKWQLERQEVAGAFRGLYGSGALLGHLPDTQRETLKSLMRQHTHRCREILRAGVDDGSFDVPDVSATAMAIITMCEYVISWHRDGGSLDAEAVAALHGELAVRMASPR